MNPSSPIPIDLILEILSRLPAKSVARFRCVSKRWASILGPSNPYFTKSLFLTMSSTKPRLLFAISEDDGVWSFFSTPQIQIPYHDEKSSSTPLVVAAEFHVEFSPGNLRIPPSRDLRYFTCAYASGLIYFYLDDCRPLVCNPITGRYATFPYLHSYGESYSFFAFEPIDKQYKILLIEYPSGGSGNKILTLGTGDMSWRKLKCSSRHYIMSQGVCINGVLYYLGETSDDDGYVICVIVCFDVRSEKFTFIHDNVDRSCRLINYKGKLAMIYWKVDLVLTKYLHVWVLEDVEKQEWSQYAYPWSGDELFRHWYISIAGVTAWGEIVFSKPHYPSEHPFYLFYFNPERNTFRRVEIQGFGERYVWIWSFANHVEDLNINDLKFLKSLHAPYVDPEPDSESE